MKYIKTFENSNYLIHIDSEKNQGKFFIFPPLIQLSYEKKKKLLIIHVEEILITKRTNTKPIWPNGHTYDVYIDNTIKLTGGFGWKYNEEEFKNINFMSAKEFYQQHQELSIDYYSYVDKMSNVPMAEWFMDEIRKCKKDLEKDTIFGSVKKYNI